MKRHQKETIRIKDLIKRYLEKKIRIGAAIMVASKSRPLSALGSNIAKIIGKGEARSHSPKSIYSVEEILRKQDQASKPIYSVEEMLREQDQASKRVYSVEEMLSKQPKTNNWKSRAYREEAASEKSNARDSNQEVSKPPRYR